MKIMLDIKAHDAMDYIIAGNDELNFDVKVESPCPRDEITFDTPIESFVYFVHPDGEPMFKNPTVVQKYPQCMRSCTLVEVGEPNSPNMFSFNSFTGEVTLATT